MNATQSRTGITLTLVGEDGNAFAVLGKAQHALKKAGKSDLVKSFLKEAMSGDYDHLLCVCQDWFDVE